MYCHVETGMFGNNATLNNVQTSGIQHMNLINKMIWQYSRALPLIPKSISITVY